MTKIIEAIRKKNPIVLHVANHVTPQHVADATNFIGGSPIMLEDELEASELTKLSNSVSLNLGSTTLASQNLILKVGKAANKFKIPVVFDPVAVGASKVRFQRAQEILSKVDVTLIRGNLGEIASLINLEWNSKGIDSGSGSGDGIKIAKKAAQILGCVIVVSGESDIVTDGKETYLIQNNAPMLSVNVGMGDVLDAILAVFLSNSQKINEIALATAILPAVAEEAMKQFRNQPAKFLSQTYDNLFEINDDKLLSLAKIERID
ncbi:hydroxyethylthiazole kinase [Fructilactobacillus vespulae]|uniref:hydroxyethylthiazole kinase n=1 Tax=Fructilactobacillus vespulae TaxID=1249630 RepID=UPI0039B6819B